MTVSQLPSRMRYWLPVVLLAASTTTRQPTLARDIERDVLHDLFTIRERAARIVLYDGPVTTAPVFSQTPLPEGMVPSPLSARALGVESISARALEALFRTHPDGWRAWYARFPGATGLIERTSPIVDGDSAVLIVGRTCGEHCQQAWIITARRTAGTRWTVARREPFPLPRP